MSYSQSKIELHHPTEENPFHFQECLLASWVREGERARDREGKSESERHPARYQLLIKAYITT
jgi:hypothetical protein